MNNPTSRITFDPVLLSVAQATGTACVVCRTDYYISEAPSVPVGFSETGEQVFACETCVPPARPSWLPDGCPSWCDWSAHHAENDLNDDRFHSGGPFTPVAMLKANPCDAEADGEPFEANAYLVQGYGEAEPQIKVDIDGTPTGLAFTPAEAEQFARGLLALVAAARA